MSGDSKGGFRIQKRDIKLLAPLADLGVIDSEQAKRIGEFGSTTRINARLLKLTAAGLLEKSFFGTIAGGRRAMYSLTPAGAAVAKVEYRRIRKRQRGIVQQTLFLNHRLAVNSVYLALRHPNVSPSDIRLLRWFVPAVQVSAAIPLVPDAGLEIEVPSGSVAGFLEVDLGTEPMRIWSRKAKMYVDLAISGEFKSSLPCDQFRVFVVALSLSRVRSISAAIVKQTNKIFWLTTLESIKRDGFGSSTWRRPGEDQTIPLV